jgi:hypothetical protein
MGVFDIEDDIVLTSDQLIDMGFERLTKNTWQLNTTLHGSNHTRWWVLPVTITYDTKRKMFRRDKKRYFVKDRGDFEMVFTSIVADTNYNNPIKIKSHFQRGNIV